MTIQRWIIQFRDTKTLRIHCAVKYPTAIKLLRFLCINLELLIAERWLIKFHAFNFLFDLTNVPVQIFQMIILYYPLQFQGHFLTNFVILSNI